MGKRANIWRRCRKLFRSAARLVLQQSPRSLAAPASAGVSYPSVAAGLLANTPILIPVFNNPTYLSRMLDQLRSKGLRNIVVVDNASTSPQMKSFLQKIPPEITLVRLTRNLGPRDIFQSAVNLQHLPNVFCVTDPDLELNRDLPDDFLVELFGLTERFKIGKAGFSLDISDRDAMRDDPVAFAEGSMKIWEWEERFWTNHVGFTEGGDPIYKAKIDTTFALYNKTFFRPDRFTAAVRVAGRYTCRHLPWYKDDRIPEQEQKHYRRKQKFSTYVRSKGGGVGA
jgi:hypothetical protein